MWTEDEWQRDMAAPGVPPKLTPSVASALFNRPVLLLASHPGLRTRRETLLASMPSTLRRLEKATRLYHDDSPKTRVGEAHEWNECRAATEALLHLGRAVLATLQEEEGE
jgi:hypothetical protein